MDAELAGKVAIVTGAGRGIGRAYAHALAAAGASVVVNDLEGADASPADGVVDEIVQAGGQAVASYDSVADFATAAKIVDTAVEAFGGVDILVANAGIIRPTYIVDAEATEWADVLTVHVLGTFNCMRHAVPQMLERGGGSIITTGDIATEVWFPRISSYRASKAAIVVLTQHAANELIESNINVNSIMPGATETRMSAEFFTSLADRMEPFLSDIRDHYEPGADDSGQIAPPETVPPLGVYLCTDEARGITGYSFQMSGPNIGVITPRTDVSYIAPNADRFTADELSQRIPDLLADKPSMLSPSTPTAR